MRPEHRGAPLAWCAVCLALAATARIMVGGEVLALPSDSIIWGLRLHSSAVGAVAGAALAVAGVLLQALLRNPLASPEILGQSSGAALGVVAWGALAPSIGLIGAPPAAALGLVGAMAALACVYGLSQTRGIPSPTTLVLVGVIVAMIASAGVTLILSLSPPDPMRPIARWLLGGLDPETPWGVVGGAALVTALVVGVSAALSPALDAMTLGEDEAWSVGVPVERVRLGLFVLSSLLIASAVVLAGPLGFVGLVCPHLVRLWSGPRHRTLVIGSALLGAALVVGADALVGAARMALPTVGRAPLGVLTTLLGGPFFIVLLRREARG